MSERDSDEHLNRQAEDNEQLDRKVDDLEKSAEKMQDRIDSTRSDWKSKEGDQSVPGAMAEDDGFDAQELDSRSLDDTDENGGDAGE